MVDGRPGGTDPSRHLFVAAGGGGDVLAASILQRAIYGEDDALPFVVTYSWDRLMVDPMPGPRDPSWFECLEPVGNLNWRVTAASWVRPPGNSLLPRLAAEMDTKFFLFDPTEGARGMRAQLRELVRLLGIARVSLVDSGGDILARGDEPELRSPMSDSLALAAAHDIGADVDVLIVGAGFDGELSGSDVRTAVTELTACVKPGKGAMPTSYRLTAADVHWCVPLLRWHPSEVNGLVIAAAMGYRGKVEIRDAGLLVDVDDAGADIISCSSDAALARNVMADSMIKTNDLSGVEDVLIKYQHHSELDYQRHEVKRYCERTSASVGERFKKGLQRLREYGASRVGQVDALSLRRAAEIIELSRDELETYAGVLKAQHGWHYHPPLWTLKPLDDPDMFRIS